MKKKITKKIASSGMSLLVAFFMLGGYFIFSPANAQASELTGKSDTMSRLEDNTASNHTIQFDTENGVAEGETITITFPAGFSMGSVGEDDIDVEDDSVDLTTGADCTASEEAGVSVSGQIVTIEICSGDGGAIAATSTVTVEIGDNATASGTGSNQITNPDIASDTTYEITFGGTMTDSGQVEVQIIMDDTVNVTGTVDESIAFSISDTEIGFGDLNSGTGRWATSDANGTNASEALPDAAHTLSIATNASGGYSITYNGATLTNAASDTITATTGGISGDGDGTPGTEQFAISASASGDASIAAGYERDATPNWKYAESTDTELVSETGATDTETISVSYLANIGNLTESGEYSTDITYIATATY